ncbi:lipopolysaccharide export system protein LptC [Methylobacterium sp. UNC300MFChir4.1]|jgi:lipopolysaccharide export system protein LptC|uniref:LPS export ABC transporter periplasmic protein LptC n=1 Tax=Methylobacterium TaxID=407 RepID=UPI000348B33C|nr:MULTISPECIES: LPS export ABC transporter periplasmic protein LptC [Methylobacterium]KQS67345.1 lipopolysaccharide-assembly, LptC-related protein [Methylobacterium sp. Leaf361]UIN36140.1 LPS export ABC transporter periplasmic protein LptC [Methylobacterium oryzae]SEF75086.1 lipopolysaccharide export system protein LptC [Methylobacterium sp. 190mf]SEH38069.1 lipopolysaccharide export system protein LptC [Methylobacterium sp. 275MFSha3.1]SEM90000.1 lipopolysaccharide export system protein LptC
MNPVEAEAGNGQAVAAARTRAHARAYRHSGRVRTMRRLIPVVAGGAVALLLGYLFNPFAAQLPGVSVGPVTLAGSKVRMENPRLSGFRQGTRGYEVTADAALQDVRKPSQIELQQMRGHIATDDQGGIARLSATSGLFDTAREALDLKDDIRIWTDKGEEARLRSAAVAFKTGSISSQEPVTVSSARANVKADTLDVVENGKRISFVGNVHVVIVSDAPGEKPQARILTSDAEAADGAR